MSDRVELTLPADPRHLRLVRLTASGMATDLGFSVDQIEDLRLAVDEACAALVEHGAPAARLELTYRAESGALHIEGRCPRAANDTDPLHPVARAVLQSTVDEFDVSGDAATDSNVFRLVKRAES